MMADMPRPSTPPPREVLSTSLQLTPEQLKRIELNRLKAKANQREKEQEASASTIANANNKRPIGVTPAVSHSPTAPSGSKPLRRDSRLGKYFEYDLSKMVNSKGGFLLEDGNEIDEEVRRKEQERERQRARQNLDPPMHLDPALNPKCKECQSMDLDQTFKKVFGCLVCKKCQNEKPEKYSLLTKTECKELLLISFAAELRDEELLPHLLKANPHAATYANMMLYVRYQVEDFAWKKWGSPEALDAEYERRTNEKKKKKNKKFEQGLKDLRKRTKEGVWQRRRDEEHKHVFGALEKGPDGMGQQVILPPTAFMGDSNQAEHEQISTSLEVEQLDDNLFRSKSLWLPAHARGVFGGQVISQALVSATNCVDPAFGLHCYFLLSASPSTPIIYHVDRVRQGRSYATLAVRAVQSGRTVFVLMCSFQKPEPWQPFHQWPMPNVPSPDECELEEMRFIKAIESPTTSPGMKRYYQDALTVKERTRSPIAIKRAKGIDSPADGTVSYMYWMQTRNSPKYEAPFQKCILSYISDLNFISSASKIMGLKRFGKGPDTVSMTIVSPRTGSGRGVVHGRMYTRDGTLVAVTSQEGVVRANIILLWTQ
ncbi:HotDog domain-containing protein [Lyophyllum atratum]|nr:HotDog domain-containing protein [Lyophyllum atratum]